MNAEAKVSENILYDIWKNQNLKGNLKTSDGRSIEIIDSGLLNSDTGGPDFKNARIRIGNIIFIGDIEIDRNYSDWIGHGHNIDNKYNSVILHVVLRTNNNHGYVYSRGGRKVPSVCIQDHIELPAPDQFLIEDEDEKTSTFTKFKCTGINTNIERSYKNQFLSRLGAERFKKKSQKIYDRLKELQFINELGIKEPVIGYDLTERFSERQFNHSDFRTQEVWMQLLYELVFEALGYSKNKLQMISLAQAADIEFINKIENDGLLTEKYEAILFRISGLTQTLTSVSENDSKEYIKRLDMHWESLKVFYDKNFLDEAIWQFFKMRPQNFPTIRIAGGAIFLKTLLHEGLINSLVKKITEIQNFTILINTLRSIFIINANGFWKNHYVFDQPAKADIKYFVGAARADEIVINVLLPFFAVYFEIFRNPQLVKKVQKVYGLYKQKTDNQIIFEVAKALNVPNSTKSAILSQGMIDLFRSYCSKNRCLECEIGKIVFN